MGGGGPWSCGGGLRGPCGGGGVGGGVGWGDGPGDMEWRLAGEGLEGAIGRN